jgi:hypothetical protein
MGRPRFFPTAAHKASAARGGCRPRSRNCPRSRCSNSRLTARARRDTCHLSRNSCTDLRMWPMSGPRPSWARSLLSTVTSLSPVRAVTGPHGPSPRLKEQRILTGVSLRLCLSRIPRVPTSTGLAVPAVPVVRGRLLQGLLVCPPESPQARRDQAYNRTIPPDRTVRTRRPQARTT